MPLIKSKSKKAFEHNIKAEMHAGKPQDQSLAIAYSVKRKAKKKMAEGGTVKEHDMPPSAKFEARPMPPRHDDSGKPAKHDSWTDDITVKQAQKPSRVPLKHPKMVPSDAFSVRLRDQEDHLEDSAKPNNGPQRQPPHEDDEMGPDRQGPKVSDMQDEHSTHRKPYAKGGRVYEEHEHGDSPTGPTNYRNRNKSSDMSGGQRKGPQGYPKYQEQAQNQKGVHTPVSGVTHFPGGKGTSEAGSLTKDRYAGKPTFEAGPDHPAKKEHKRVIEESRKINPKLKGLAKGGEVESSDYDHPLDGKYEDDLLDLGPSEDEGRMMADSHNEMDADMENSNPLDMEHEHNNGRKPYAEGGSIHDEEELEHDASIAGAIMRKRKSEDQFSDSDEDSQMYMAEGGEVDLSQNADEEPNNEDQMSFDALRKENYSESEGLNELDSPKDSNEHGHELSDEDAHDMVSKIRKLMSKRSPITK